MVIVDASVVYKWFEAKEEGRIQARLILKQHLLKESEIVIPDLLLYEIGNVWSTKTNLSSTRTKRNIEKLKQYSLTIIAVDFDLLVKAASFAQKYHVSLYDAMYAVLAQEKKCKLITADSKFIAKVHLPFIKHLSKYSV